MATTLPLGLYVHFPWCVAKCPYCDFNSHSLRGELPADQYVDALLADLQSVPEAFSARAIDTIFFGGGTPSLFGPDHFERLLDGVKRRFTLAADAEITLEANPGAVEHAAFAGYRAAGINRLSLGVQSLQDDKLKALGRIHSAADARSAFSEARAAGFDNINLDLMYALPEQSLEEALSDLAGVMEMQPEHISHYHLTLEPNTVFYARPPVLPDADLGWDIQIACAEQLTSGAYENYEVSAWAQSGRRSRHNLNYWQYGDYLGIGAGAHAKLTDSAGERWREIRPANPRAYLEWARTCDAGRELISAEDARFEFMLNNLRLRNGFTLGDFERRTGQQAESLQPLLEQAFERGLLENAGKCIRPSAMGWRFLDDLQGIFLPA